eukprot:4983596-Lingulodinium_polyedra.AAC.1
MAAVQPRAQELYRQAVAVSVVWAGRQRRALGRGNLSKAMAWHCVEKKALEGRGPADGRDLAYGRLLL